MDPPPVQYVSTSDGFRIAYTVSGEGPTLVYMPFSFNNVGRVPTGDWGQGPLLERLVRHVRLVRYDDRGQGLSTRGLGESHSVQAYERDLEAVVDRLQSEHVILMGGAFSSHVAVRYAVRHPEHVRALVLCRTGVTLRSPAAFNLGLASSDWDLFVNSLLGAVQANERISPEERHSAIAGMKTSATQADWLMYARVAADSTIEDELPRLQIPTLVLAESGNVTMSVAETARIASLIANARLVFVDESGGLGAMAQPVLDFLATLPVSEAPRAAAVGSDGLSSREIEVLRLVAAGRSNQQIADELVISLNTVARHVSNIFDKTGAANRVEAASYAHLHKLV